MASAKGYHSYRGRGSKLKVFLAILLCLVILAAAAFIVLQEHIVFDERGVPHLEIPWQREEPPEEPQVPEEEPQLDLVIQEPPGPPPVQAFSMAAGPITREGWTAAAGGALLSSVVPYNAAAVTLKDADGKVYFDSGAALPQAVKVAADTGEVLAEITGGEKELGSIARLACLLDPVTARVNVTDMGLKNTGGYIFYDGNNHTWLDPAKPGTVEFLTALALEAAALGFDELLLTDVSYPTEGKIHKIAYTGEKVLSDNVAALLQSLRTALEPYEILLSIELPEAVVTGGPDETAGLDLARIAPLVDRIYVLTPEAPAETLAAAVTAASETTDFVPELALEAQAAGSERCLILPQES